MSYLDADFSALWPAVLLAGGGLVVLLLEVSRPALRRMAGPIAVLSLAASAAALYLIGCTSVGESPFLHRKSLPTRPRL